MASEVTVWDLPNGETHRVVGYHPSPDPQRPNMPDHRVLLLVCGMALVLGGPGKRPDPPRLCRGCFG